MGDRNAPSLTQAEHIGFEDGENIEAKRVGNYSWDGTKWARARNGVVLTQRYDYASTTIIYTAEAATGTADASTGWIITKYDLSSTNNASGKVATDVSWTNRAAGTYA